jgi:diadenosine tetraphosphate (Ap4A) HIT family hydrolase
MAFMDDLKISNEIAKEHLMDLCTDTKITDKFKNLDTQKKSAFTRTYNKAHKEITAVKKGKGATVKINAEESDGEESVDSMLDEVELEAIMKGKAQEKEFAR